MRLRRISIQNFRNLRKIDVYPRETTVVIGENNTGKSNFLHALRLLFDQQAERLRLDLSENDINNAARGLGVNWFSITVEVGDLQKHVEVETCFKERIAKDGDETFVTIEGRYEQDDSGEYIWQAQVMPPCGRFNEPIPMSRRMFRSIPLYFLDPIRDASRDTRATGRGVLAQLLGDVSYADVQHDVERHLRDANAALSAGKEISLLERGLTEQLTSLVPGGQSQLSLAVADEDPTNLMRGLRLNIRETPEATQVDLARQGTGLQNLALVAMFRHRVASERSGTPILAIEEPEAHLHPHAQRRLFTDLEAIDAPILITTHSTAIVRRADPRDLLLFRAVGSNETKAYQLDSLTIGESDLKDLSLLMRGGRTDLFFSRSIIIVEGESELIALPAFAEALGCDLDRDGISVVEAGGNNYGFILRACQPDQFAIPAVVTYDTDVLRSESKLLKEARDLGLITDEIYQSCRAQTPCALSNRKAVLDDLGWIGVVECFEEVVCRNGYFDAVIRAIEDADPEHGSHARALDAHLRSNVLERDVEGVVSFIKRRDNLKIPVARAVANAVKTVQQVPDCYARAIQRAMLQSIGGIVVDAYFEMRACAAGLMGTIINTVESQGAMSDLEQFLTEMELQKNAIGISKFFIISETGKGMRELVKSTVADAIEDIGCKEYAESIRKAEPFIRRDD